MQLASESRCAVCTYLFSTYLFQSVWRTTPWCVWRTRVQVTHIPHRRELIPIQPRTFCRPGIAAP